MDAQAAGDVVRHLAETEKQLATALVRLDRLERAYTRGRRARALSQALAAALAMLAFGVGRVAVTRAQGESVTAPFTVVGADGKKLLEVKQGGHGNTLLTLYNDQQQLVAQIRSDQNGGGAVVVADGRDSKDAARVILSVSPEGDGFFGMYDRHEQPLADIYRGAHGGQGLGIYDQGGKLALQLGAWDNGSSQIDLRDGTKVRAVLRSTGDSASLQFLNKSTDDLPAVWLGYDPGVSVGSGGEQQALENRGLQVFMDRGSAAAEVLSMNADAGGLVKVYGETGQPQATMMTTADEGGRVIVARADGTAHLDLHGEKGVLVYNKTSTIAALGGDESGLLELSAPDGHAIVQAAMLDDGRGVVRAGPQIGGPPGGLTGLPWGILGRLGQ